MLTHHPPPAPSRRTLAVVPDNLQQIAAAAPEAKQMSAQRVATQNLLHLERQARKALPHVGVSRGQPHPHAGRDGDHRRRLVLASALRSADTVEASTDPVIRILPITVPVSLRNSASGVAGFEPATPSSRTRRAQAGSFQYPNFSFAAGILNRLLSR
jgi:hypothetical protein